MQQSEYKVSDSELQYLLSPISVKERCEKVFSLALDGGTAFLINQEGFQEAAELTLEVTKENYPNPEKIPFHSRWEHFNVGGVDRIGALLKKLSNVERDEQARILLELVVVSVLLDAGAGAEWSYVDTDGKKYSRSEGLAVASLALFESGLLSSEKRAPMRADAKGLMGLSAEDLGRVFQVSAENPLIGLNDRASLLNRLGKVVSERSEYFLVNGEHRIGALYDHFNKMGLGRVTASQILSTLLLAFDGMWPARTKINGIGFGDLWVYEPIGESAFERFLPFHKLSQWLSYSCFYPLEHGGLLLSGSEILTGLPEYRNGGLLLDLGVLKPRDPKLLHVTYDVNATFILEWRALTVASLFRIADLVRRELNLSELALPLGKVLQGGTWAAGRRMAQRLRGGLSPVKLNSDGTVF